MGARGFRDAGLEDEARVAAYLRRCRELVALCRENGWIDDDTVDWEVKARGPGSVDVAVSFDEVTVKGAGCEARRLPCFGYLRLWLDEEGGVVRAEPL